MAQKALKTFQTANQILDDVFGNSDARAQSILDSVFGTPQTKAQSSTDASKILDDVFGPSVSSPAEREIPERMELYSGGPISDIIDTISIPFYGFTGMFTNLATEIKNHQDRNDNIDWAAVPAGFVDGIKNRASWVDWLQKERPEIDADPIQIGSVKIPSSIVMGTVMDIVLDPTWLLPPVKVASLIGKGAQFLGDLRPVAKAVGTVSRTKVVQTFIEALNNQATRRAIVQRFTALQDDMARNIASDVEEAVNLAKRAQQTLPREAQVLVSDYVEAGSREARKNVLWKAQEAGFDPAAIRSIGEAGIALDAKMGQKLVDAGFMSKETFMKWRGKHLRRMYERHEWETVDNYLKRLADIDPARAAEIESQLRNLDLWARKPRTPRMPTGITKARKNLPLEVRQALGEIKEFGPRIAKETQLASRLVNRDEFFKKVAEEFGSDTFKPGYMRLPEAKNLGALSYKWVPKYVHSEIMHVVQQPKRWQAISKKLVGLWKLGKVIDNPATHARNIVSNMMLADWGPGLSPARVDIYAEAAIDLLKRGRWYQEAKRAGSFLTDTFAEAEVGKFLEEMSQVGRGDWDNFRNSLNTLTRIFAQGQKKLAEVYEFEEQWFKMAVYIFKRKQGLTPERAAKMAEDWLFNYRKVPAWLDKLRSGELGILTVPFATFAYKAFPKVAEAMYRNPARVTKWFKMASGTSKAGDREKGEQEARVLPDWMKDGYWIRLPVEDEYGRTLYLDARYIIPFGDVAEIGGLFASSNARTSQSILQSIPYAALQQFPFLSLWVDLEQNINAFTGQPIVSEGASPSQRDKAYIQYVADFLLPPLVGGYSFRQLKEAVLKVPDWKGRTRALDKTIMSVLAGIKTRPIDASDELYFRASEIRNQINKYKQNMSEVANDPALSQSAKEKIWRENMEQIQECLEEYTLLFID